MWLGGGGNESLRPDGTRDFSLQFDKRGIITRHLRTSGRSSRLSQPRGLLGCQILDRNGPYRGQRLDLGKSRQVNLIIITLIRL